MKFKFEVEIEVESDATEAGVRQGLQNKLEVVAFDMSPEIDEDHAEFEILNVQVTEVKTTH